jgi:hypothetical protein
MVDVGDRIDPDRILHDGTLAVDDLAPSANPSRWQANRRRPSSPGFAASPPTGSSARSHPPAPNCSTTSPTSTAPRRRRGRGPHRPDMLGASGPRTYFVAFQNNAEVKGTGACSVSTASSPPTGVASASPAPAQRRFEEQRCARRRPRRRIQPELRPAVPRVSVVERQLKPAFPLRRPHLGGPI